MAMIWLSFQLRDLGHLTVRFLDVGQGDAALIITPAGNQILVDGGPDNTLIHKIGRALPLWDRTIELVVVSHPHADHLVGLVELLRRYRVRQVISTGVGTDTPEYQTFHQELQRQHIAEIVVDGAARQRLEPGLELRWFPPLNINSKDLNTTSLALQLAYGSTTFLLLGDLPASSQEALPLAQLKSDVLKVAHHGSSDALSLTAHSLIHPAWAVISVGENNYGHPSPRVQKTLERINTKVLTTRANWDVRLQSNSRTVRFFRSPQSGR